MWYMLKTTVCNWVQESIRWKRVPEILLKQLHERGILRLREKLNKQLIERESLHCIYPTELIKRRRVLRVHKIQTKQWKEKKIRKMRKTQTKHSIKRESSECTRFWRNYWIKKNAQCAQDIIITFDRKRIRWVREIPTKQLKNDNPKNARDIDETIQIRTTLRVREILTKHLRGRESSECARY